MATSPCRSPRWSARWSLIASKLSIGIRGSQCWNEARDRVYCGPLAVPPEQAPDEPGSPNHEPDERAGGDSMPYELKLFSGNANRPLAEEIAKTLAVPLGQAEVARFSDGEVFVQI